MKSKYPTLDEMLQSERREASIALRHLAGESIDAEPLWMRGTDDKLILLYAGALNLAELFGIERVSETIKQAPRNGMPATFATVRVKLGTNTRIGAAVSRHPQVACELAFRNGVKQIVIGISDKPPTNNKLSAVKIRRIDRTPRGEQRWKEAVKASNLIASLVPNREDVDWNVQQEDLGGLEELAIETLMEGF